jgi:hypothetical protein
MQGAAWQLPMPDVCSEELDMLHVVSEMGINYVLWYCA